MSPTDEAPLADVIEFLRRCDLSVPPTLPPWMSAWFGQFDTDLDEVAIRRYAAEQRMLRPHVPSALIVVHPAHPDRATINRVADLSDAHVLENPYLTEPDQVLVVDIAPPPMPPPAADGGFRGQRAQFVVLDEVLDLLAGGQIEGVVETISDEALRSWGAAQPEAGDGHE